MRGMVVGEGGRSSGVLLYSTHTLTAHVRVYVVVCSTPWERWAAVSSSPVRAAVSSSSASTRTSSATAAASVTSSPTSSASGWSRSTGPPTTTSTCRDRRSRRRTCWTRSADVASAHWAAQQTTVTRVTRREAAGKTRAEPVRVRSKGEETYPCTTDERAALGTVLRPYDAETIRCVIVS